MTYTLMNTIDLGSSVTGVASDLRGQLMNSGGANVGSAISAGFIEIGGGIYGHPLAVPDRHQGYCKYYRNTGGTVVGVVPINPPEFEPLFMHTSNAQGAGSNTITLSVAASGVDDFYVGFLIRIVSGPGAGQTRLIYDYMADGNVAYVNRPWELPMPTSASVYEIYGHQLPLVNGLLYVTAASVQGNINGNMNGNIVGSVNNVLGGVAGSLGGNVMGGVAGNVSGSVGSVVGGMGGSVAGNVNGSVGSVVGSVGSVVGNVNGSVGSVTGDVGGDLIGSVLLNVEGSVQGNVDGSVGSVLGNVGGNLVGNVQGNVQGNLEGDVVGNVQQDVLGNLVGNVNGSVGGDLVGNVQGAVLGAVGSVTGDVGGSVNGHVLGNLVGNVQGDVNGNLLGDVQGDVLGSVHEVVADVGGNVNGHLLGNVQGNVNGHLIGNVQGSVLGNVAGSVGSVAGVVPPSGADYTSTRAVKLDNLDTNVGSRLPTSAYVAPNNAGITTLLGDVSTLLTRLTATRAGYLDAPISSRLAAADYVPGGGGGTDPDIDVILAGVNELLDRLTDPRALLLDNLSNLNTTITSRMSQASYVAPDNAGIDNLETLLTPIRAGYMDLLPYLDAPVSSRLPTSSYVAPDNAGIDNLEARLTPTRAGYLDNLPRLDVPVSSVSGGGGGGGGDTPGTTELLSRLTPERADNLDNLDGLTPARVTNLDNLDVPVSTRLASVDYVPIVGGDTPGTTELLSRLTEVRADSMDNLPLLNVGVDTRLAAADYVAPDNAGIAAIAGDVGEVSTDVDTLLTRLTEPRALLLDNLADLSNLDTLNDNLTAILALPDVMEILGQDVPEATIMANITGYLTGDDIHLGRTIVPVPSGQHLTKAWLTVKRHMDDTDAEALLQLEITPLASPAGQITDDGAADGIGALEFTLTPDQSRAIGTGKPRYDIQAVTDNNEVHTYYDGFFVLRQDVTLDEV